MAAPVPFEISFRGRPLRVRPGETLLSALAADGLPRVQRSIRYHRARGPFCGVGTCTQCLVRVNGQPNVRACRYRPRPGDSVRTENSWPGPELDLLGGLDLLFRRGIDTLHGFTRPGWARPVYHGVIRRLAGYGRMADGPPPPVPETTPLLCDTLVVGAGAAGRAAALRTAEAGREVVLLDRNRVPDPPEGVRTYAEASALFLSPPRTGAGPPIRLLAQIDGAVRTVRAERILLAPGGYDAHLLFPGNDRPGVMTGDGALALRAPPGEPPFHRALLVGGGPRALQMIERFGPRLAAVVAPGPVHGGIAERAANLRIPVYPRTLVVEGVGRHRLRRVRLAPRGGGTPFDLTVDAAILAHRRLPNGPLFFQAGVRMHWRDDPGAYYPTLSGAGATSVPSVFAAGEAAGIVGPEGAAASGRAAADAALGRSAPPPPPPSVPRPEAGRSELAGYYQELFGRTDRGGAKCIACACEDVTVHELAEAHRAGYRGIEVIKRYTGLGTGLCQGRYCVPEALLLLSQWERRPPSEVGYLTQRPPVFPTPLAQFARSAAEPAEEGR
ncbi:MAG: 2Fe-2S iron-sulfur cluster-binding protein [Thermoplasmata archaeon]